MSAAGPPHGANSTPAGGSAAAKPQAWGDHASADAPRSARAADADSATKLHPEDRAIGTVESQHMTASARPAPTAGGRLRAAREATGLSVDAVAQQLKLAPRQVNALEDDDWQRLPGRTFVRGFARNYARFLQLDPDAVLALLPAADTAPALERPTLTASRRPMGEIPVERVARPSPARWLVPLLLLVILGVIGYYQFSRTPIHLPALLSSSATDGSAHAPTTALPVAPAAPPGTMTSALPNPVAGGASGAPDTTAPTNAATSASTSALPAPSAADVTPPNAAGAGPNVNSGAAPAASTAAPVTAPSAVSAEVPLVLTFKGTSWAEVKDAKGRVVLQITGGPGMTQTVSATPPLELSLGNAPGVGVTFRGQSLDLSPYTRGNVARVSLQ